MLAVSASRAWPESPVSSDWPRDAAASAEDGPRLCATTGERCVNVSRFDKYRSYWEVEAAAYEERLKSGNYYAQGHRLLCNDCGKGISSGESIREHECTPRIMEIREFIRWRDRYGSPVQRSNEMASVAICDRDGVVFPMSASGEAMYRPNLDVGTKRYTLCPDCSEALYDFLNPDGPRATAIVKGFDPSNRPERVTDPAATSRAALEAEYGESA